MQMMETNSQIAAINSQTAATNSKVDNFISRDSSMSGENSNARSDGKNHSGSTSSTTPKSNKLNFPRYDGDEDPTSWICRVEQFFDYQQTEDEEKLPLAAYHLEGAAQMWYQLFKEDEESPSWENLKTELYNRYGPTRMEDHFGDLTKLRQGGSVRDYQVEFERLLSRVGKLSTQHQLGCFVSGLKEMIRIEVQVAKPTSLTKATGLARLFEAKTWSLKKFPYSGNRRSTYSEQVPPLPSPNLTKPKKSPCQEIDH
jgi:hypothetical protein